MLPAICSGAPIIAARPTNSDAGTRVVACIDWLGLPEDFLQVVDCSVPEADVFCRDPRVEVISFTGSEKVGGL